MKTQLFFQAIFGSTAYLCLHSLIVLAQPTIVDPGASSIPSGPKIVDFDNGPRENSKAPIIEPELNDFNEPTQGANFQCLKTDTTGFATIAMTPDGPTAPMINWTRKDFNPSGYTPSKRCEQVTQRLNDAANKHGSGKLSNLWITSGRVNRLPVICYVRSTDSGCGKDNVLFTISPSSPNFKNPSEALVKLVNFSVSGTGSPIQESAGRRYINLAKLVNASKQRKKGGSTNVVRPVSPSVRPAPVRPSGGGRL